jgi:hypothetical protein
MDVAIALDVTGSMGGALSNVQAEIPNIVNAALAASGGDLRLGAVSIDGQCTSEPPTYGNDFITIDSPLDVDVATVQAAIMALALGNGCGAPEASDEALNAIVNTLGPRELVAPNPPMDQTGTMNAFRDECVKITVVITDNEPGGFDDNYQVGVDDVNAAAIANQAAASGILISAVQVGGDPVAQPIMQNYATTTGGVYLNVPSDGTGTGEALTAIIETCGSACDPAPHTQGYWHRQCLGIPAVDGGIDPGRNGRGPQEPTEPDFAKTLLPAVSAELEDLLFEFGACVSGMDASPPSDQCEKAIKQFTALLFNRASNRLQNSCEVDLSAYGCSSTNIGDLVNEIAGLINGGDCQTAKNCAGAVNEGEALVEAGQLVNYSVAPDDLPMSNDGLAPTPEEVALVRSTSGAVARPAAAEVEAPADASTDVVFVTGAALSTEEAVSIEEPEVAPSDTEYVDGLLTALGGGYEPEERLDMVVQLMERVDQDLHSLLVAHLLDIADEARALGEDRLANRAEQLIRKLEPPTEE